MSRLASSVTKRYISIAQTSVISNSVLPTAGQLLDVPDTLSVTEINNPEFRILGSPPSLLSVALAPSVPVYIKRGSLVSLYSSSANTDLAESVIVARQTLSPLKNFFLGGFAINYQKLVATRPHGALISSVAKNFWNQNNVSQKSIVTVVLDGRVDWAIFPRNALQAYSGPSLSIGVEFIPKKISRALAKAFSISKNTSVGLRSWTKCGYNFVSGRGKVAIVGDGQIYRVILKENETYLANKNNLLALSVNGESDLSNCVFSHTIRNKLGATNLKTVPEEVVPLQSDFISRAKRIFGSIFKLTSSTASSVHDSLIGNKDFVKIVGPRNILIQTNTNSQLKNAARSFQLEDNEIRTTEAKIEDVSSLSFVKPVDETKVAPISDGKVESRSIGNLHDEVKKLQTEEKVNV